MTQHIDDATSDLTREASLHGWLRHLPVLILLVLAVSVGACGPSRGAGGGGGAGDDDDDNGGGGDDDDVDDHGGDADADADADCTEPVPEVCNDAIDDDCDGEVDCADDDCASDAVCSVPGCGELQTPEASLELPDGACPEDETQPCEGYESAISFTGFTAGQELLDITKLLGICLNIEHSWMRDLVIYAECPSGTRVMLSDFEGHSGGEVFLGEPNDDDGTVPVPGGGSDYCWTPTADNRPWIPYANDTGVGTLPAGDYQSSQPLDAFVGCPLNGDWTLRVEDRWGDDNGFIFSWSVKFDRSLVEDCSTWLE